MSTRTKVLALLLGLLGFLVAAASVSVAVRARAENALLRVTQRDVPLLALSTRVTAVHLKQAFQLERALDASYRPGPMAVETLTDARSHFETDAAGIWNRLRLAIEFAERAAEAGDPDALSRLEGIARIDRAHNAYAESVRLGFDRIEAGDLASAERAAARADVAKLELESVLGVVLEESAASAASASALARDDARIARVIVWVLLSVGLTLATAVFVTVIRLVSEMRTLSGLLPICAQCKKIRDDQGYWNQLESYLTDHSHATLTHGLCRECQGDMHEKILRSREANATA